MVILNDLDKVNRDVISIMTRLYGSRLSKIILFGSYARGDFHAESDIDYLIVLKEDNVSSFTESKYVSPLTSDYHLETGIPITSVVVAENQLLKSSRPFFKEVRKDQKLVYER